MKNDFEIEDEFWGNKNLKTSYSTIFLAFIIAISAISLLWHGYNIYNLENYVENAPIIMADNKITKMRPQDPEGMQVSNMDKDIYNNIALTKSFEEEEGIVPSPEEPLSNDLQNNITPKSQEEIIYEAANESELIDKELQSLNQMKEDIKNYENRSEQKIEQINHETEEKNAPQDSKDKASEETQKSDIPEIVNVKPKESKILKLEQNVKFSGAKKNIYKIQLASMKSEKQANAEWARLKIKFSKQLSGSSHSLEKTNIKHKGMFYRLHAGPFKNYNDANKVCKQLISKKQSCIIVNPK